MLRYTFGPFLLDSSARVLLREGKPLELAGKTFDTLLVLVQNRGRVIDKEELVSIIWRGAAVEDANLTQSIYTLRKVLGDRPRDHRFVATVPGRGYQFVAPVTEVVATSEPEVSPEGDARIRAKRPLGLWLGVLALGVSAGLTLLSLHNEPLPAPILGTPVQLTNDGRPKNELVTDGVRVFYASPAQRNLSDWRMLQVSVNGGESRPINATGQAMSPFDISPDHSQLLLGSSALRQSNDGWESAGRLWFQPLAGGPARESALKAQDAAWSPDGRDIVYAVAQYVKLARTDGTRLRNLAGVPGVASGLRWSPSGDRIRFTLHYGVALKDSAIWEVSPDKGNAHPLFPGSKARSADGVWTPDGKYYLFSQENNGASQLWALPERKTWLGKSVQAPMQLTTGPMETFLPTPTPDGKRVLFYGVTKRSIVLKRDKSSGSFEPFLPGISGAHISFSRTGKWIAYSSYPEHELWRAAGDGGDRLQLSPPGIVALLPAISPDGSRIAFVGSSPGRPISIYVINRDGGDLETIAPTEPKGIIEPAWSPDGNSLVLGAAGDIESKAVLYRFDFAGKVFTVLPGSEGLWSPRWSPDGQYIAALGVPDTKLMLYDLKSQRKTQLTDSAAAYPEWAHDGQYIYFTQGDEHEAWCRINMYRREVERLASLADAGALPAKPSRGVPTWINSWAGLTPDDSLLIASEAGSTEIYSAALIER